MLHQVLCFHAFMQYENVQRQINAYINEIPQLIHVIIV